MSRIDLLEERVALIEERLNDMVLLTRSLVGNRELSSMRVVLEDQINTLKSEILLLTSEIEGLKARIYRGQTRVR